MNAAPASISAKRAGISLHFLRHHLTHTFNLHRNIIDTCLEKHYLLYWHPSHFDAMLHDGKIYQESQTDKAYMIGYQVSYIDCTPSSLRKCRQIKMSFRKPKKEYPVGNYVLIMKGDTE